MKQRNRKFALLLMFQSKFSNAGHVAMKRTAVKNFECKTPYKVNVRVNAGIEGSDIM